MASGAGVRFLVVDDDEMMLHMLPPHLAKLPLARPVSSVETAGTPERALEQLRRTPPGPLVVVSDFNLKASMNGLDLLGAVARERPDAVRVLFSGYASEQIGDATRGGTAHAFLEKPLRIQELLAPLARIVDAHLRAA